MEPAGRHVHSNNVAGEHALAVGECDFYWCHEGRLLLLRQSQEHQPRAWSTCQPLLCPDHSPNPVKRQATVNTDALHPCLCSLTQGRYISFVNDVLTINSQGRLTVIMNITAVIYTKMSTLHDKKNTSATLTASKYLYMAISYFQSYYYLPKHRA